MGKIFWNIVLIILFAAILGGFLYRITDRPPKIEFAVEAQDIKALEDLMVRVAFSDDRGLDSSIMIAVDDLGLGMSGLRPAGSKPDRYMEYLLKFRDFRPEDLEKLKEKKSFIIEASVFDTIGQKTVNRMLVLNL